MQTLTGTQNGKYQITRIVFQELTGIRTKAGILVPRLPVDGGGHLHDSPLELYASGQLKVVPLQEKTVISTPLGELAAELVTFHENGALHQLFPDDEKLSGFRNTTQETASPSLFLIPTPLGVLSLKPLYLQFYDTGELQSIAFKPGENITIATPAGKLRIRKGLTFYKNGHLQSCEPACPVTVPSPLGMIEAFNPATENSPADAYSLCFDSEGEVESITTIKNGVNMLFNGEILHTFAPALVHGYGERQHEEIIDPLRIRFTEEYIHFMHKNGIIGKASRHAEFRLSDFYPSQHKVA